MFKSLNLRVFLPPFLLLLISSILSIVYEASFLAYVNQLNVWILKHFDWLFSWATFLFLVLILIIYFTPFAKIKIGGVFGNDMRASRCKRCIVLNPIF